MVDCGPGPEERPGGGDVLDAVGVHGSVWGFAGGDPAGDFGRLGGSQC